MQWVLNILMLLLSLYAVWQLVMLWQAGRCEGKAAPPLHEVLPEGVMPQPRMLLYFYSEHCGVCRGVTPLVDELGRDRTGVVKMDVRRHLYSARRFGIRGTPSLVLVERGKIARVHVGHISDGMLQRFYDGRSH